MKKQIQMIFLVMGCLFQIKTLATELRRETSMPLETCDTSDFSPELVRAQRYVNAIKNHIVESNPQIFHDDLANENICIGVTIAPTEGRAWANSRKRMITIENETLLRAQNDAQVAFVIAHELGHIALRHAYLDGNPVTGSSQSRAAELLRDNIQTGEQIDSLMDRRTEPAVQAQLQVLNSRQSADRQELDALIAAAIGEDAVNNWMEAEADKAGAYYYLASGYTPAELDWRTEQVIYSKARSADVYEEVQTSDPQQRLSWAYQSCQVGDAANMSEPARGHNRYPNECWSIWDLRHNEVASSSRYRELMGQASGVAPLSGPSLAEVKVEIQAHPFVGGK